MLGMYWTSSSSSTNLSADATFAKASVSIIFTPKYFSENSFILPKSAVEIAR